jgi:WD40 repeat protein
MPAMLTTPCNVDVPRVSFITGSYDRTCKVWDTASGEELHTLEGHKNVVYAIAFNNPYGYVHPSLHLLTPPSLIPPTYWLIKGKRRIVIYCSSAVGSGSY